MVNDSIIKESSVHCTVYIKHIENSDTDLFATASFHANKHSL
jgi:hypothetical protein